MEIDNILRLLGAKCEKSNLLAVELLKYTDVKEFIKYFQNEDKKGIYINGKFIAKLIPGTLMKYKSVKGAVIVSTIPHLLFYYELIPVDSKIINIIINYVYELYNNN